MGYLLTVQINMFMCLLLAVCLAVAFLKLDLEKTEHKLFIGMVLSILALLGLEIWSVVLNAEFNAAVRADGHLVALNKLVNVVGFALVPFPPLLLLLFLHSWISRPIPRILLPLYAAPLLASVILALLSYHGGVLFNISPLNEYSRGEYFLASPLVSYAYFLLNAVFIWKNRSRLRVQEIVFLLATIIIPAFIGLVQLMYFVYLTIWNSWAVSAVVLFVYILVYKSEMDELTRLGNRRVYREIIFKARRMKELRMSIAMLDMDDLKKINDAYGHGEGDHAIRVLADGMRRFFGREFHPMRFGGDEFAAVHFDDDPAVLAERLAGLEAYLEEYNASSGKPYRISFSHGIAVSGAGECVNDLLRRCDKIMYERKRRRICAD
ncbi:GGDEF domain-containing protein [Desulfovibrio aminophilus]|uniref:GGDEF domain-containing protein n=1 Tax=Desulfovibrio aminophilus TaxID=81425 RepID=UPI000400CC01|nr:GGDEF domain-containing protein [Desulfovibrio aminophilus]